MAERLPDGRLPQIGIRVTGEMRDRIRIEAERHFGGNESLLIREATSLYLDLRERFGPHFEPRMSELLAETEKEPIAA